MADPLSIAGLVIGALQASAETSGALLKLYSSLKNAPDLIAALSNEASDTRAVLLRVQDACDALSKLATPQAAESLQSLRDLVGDAKTSLAELDWLAKKLEAEKGSWKRVKWVLQKSNAASLKVHLREVRTKISDVLVSSTSASASRIQLELADIKVLVPQSHAETQAKVDGLSGVVESVFNKTEQNTKRLDDLSMVMQMMAIEQSWALYKTRLKGGQSTNWKPSTQQRRIPRGVEPRNRHGGSFSSQALFLINLRPSMAHCADDCPCCCHRPPARGGRPSNLVPAMLKAYIGGLFVGYNGGPDTMATCDSRHCAKEKKAHVQVSYAFPAWCALPPLHLLVESSSRWRFKIGLVHTRVRDDSSYPLYDALLRVDLPALRRLLDLDPMAVCEIDPDGYSNLILAFGLWIIGNNSGSDLAEAVKCLLFAGADPGHQNINGGSVRDVASYALLVTPTNHHQRAAWEEIGRLLNICDYLDDLEIPFLHKVVSGICPIPIDGFLSSSAQDPSFDINAVSYMGSTALSLACCRGDEASVRALIRHGADCSFGDILRDATLSGATLSGATLSGATMSAACSDSIMTALIKAGADLSSTNAVLYAACQNNAAAIRTLVQAGASLCGRDPDSIPLDYAAGFNAPDAIRALCELGATVDARDADGYTALHTSIVKNSHASLRVLLEYGADHRLTAGTPTGAERPLTILDIAARCSDVAMMDAVASLDLKCFDVGSDNGNGRYMRYLFEKRFPPPTDELREAFERLFAAAVRASLEPWPGEGSESEEKEEWEEEEEEEEEGGAEWHEDMDEQDVFFDAEESPVSHAAGAGSFA